jgi:hypothetical protein
MLRVGQLAQLIEDTADDIRYYGGKWQVSVEVVEENRSGRIYAVKLTVDLANGGQRAREIVRDTNIERARDKALYIRQLIKRELTSPEYAAA